MLATRNQNGETLVMEPKSIEGQGPRPTAVPVFCEPDSAGPRSWGQEILLGVASSQSVKTPGYGLKLLEMKAGAGGGLQYHLQKDEMSHVLQGRYQFIWADENGVLRSKILTAGDTVHIPTGTVHQGIALTDCKIIEAGTPHLNDRVNVGAEYGQEVAPGTLPSTTLEEVKTL